MTGLEGMEKEVRICSELPGFPDRTDLEITRESLEELWDEINQSYLGIKVIREDMWDPLQWGGIGRVRRAAVGFPSKAGDKIGDWIWRIRKKGEGLQLAYLLLRPMCLQQVPT